MAAKFDKITGRDEIFNNPEYIADSLIFNSIESARNEDTHNMYSDHKNVIISTQKTGHKVWIWTSSAIKDDIDMLISICRFLSDCNIPKAEIYVKQDVSQHLSDLYALTSLEINYIIKDEFSLAVFTYKGQNIHSELADDETIIRIDNNNPEHVKLASDFYTDCKDEFRWNEKFERKLNEYLNTELYGLIKDGKIVAVASIGSRTEKYIRIKSIAVLKNERNKGYGFKMCAFAVHKIEDYGFTPILYTHIGNAAAVALWKKSDFKLDNQLYLLKVEDQK